LTFGSGPITKVSAEAVAILIGAMAFERPLLRALAVTLSVFASR